MKSEHSDSLASGTINHPVLEVSRLSICRSEVTTRRTGGGRDGWLVVNTGNDTTSLACSRHRLEAVTVLTSQQITILTSQQVTSLTPSTVTSSHTLPKVNSNENSRD
ncbi:hypothetical protein ACOMHN_052035 [Nucella lapillus]